MGDNSQYESSLLLRHRIKPDYAVYVRQGQTVQFYAYSDVASEEVRFTGEFINTQGDVSFFQATVICDTAGIYRSQALVFGEGWIIACAAHDYTGNLSVGEGRAYIDVYMDPPGEFDAVQVIGPVTFSRQMSGGLVPLQSPSRMAQAVARSVTTVSNPAAAADWSHTYTTYVSKDIVAVRAQLVTDANVANRVVTLSLTDGTRTLYSVTAATAQTAGLTHTYNWSTAPFLAEVVGTARYYGIPHGLFMNRSYVLGVSTTNKQAADQWSAIAITVRQEPMT